MADIERANNSTSLQSLQRHIDKYDAERREFLSQVAACTAALHPMQGLRRLVFELTGQVSQLHQDLARAETDLAQQRGLNDKKNRDIRVLVRMDPTAACGSPTKGSNGEPRNLSTESADALTRVYTFEPSPDSRSSVPGSTAPAKDVPFSKNGDPSSLLQQLEGAENALCQATRTAIQASMERDTALQESARQEAQGERTLSKLQTELAASHRQVEELQLALFSQQSKTEQLMREEQQRHNSELEGKLRDNDQASRRREKALTEAQGRCARLEDRLHALQQRRAADLEGWTQDISALRRRLAGLEGALRQTSIVERMPDDEKRDAVLAKYDRLLKSQGVPKRMMPEEDSATRSRLESQLIRKDLMRMAEDLQHRLTLLRREDNDSQPFS